MKTSLKSALAALAIAVGGSALADINIGVSLPLTGPASGLGIPMNNALKLWPGTIAGEKINLFVLDDATDPTKGVQNAQRLISENKVDILLGSAATPVAIAMADTAASGSTVQLAMSPMPLPPGKDHWTFRITHSNDIMAAAIAAHMSKVGVKTAGVLAYTDAYGEAWVQALNQRLAAANIRLIATERFARTDTSATAQAIKLVAANPDVVVVVASGSGAVMPHFALLDRGFKGNVYQTHGAATRDLIRIGGKRIEGALLSSSPVVVAEQLPAEHPLKAAGLRFIKAYEGAYGPDTRNALSAHGWDAFLVLEAVLPQAMKKAKPGTPEFRAAVRDAMESSGGILVTGGTLNYTATDHWGYRSDAGIVMKIVNGNWSLER